jgi:membrane protein YqaA with SNARE-associated domain
MHNLIVWIQTVLIPLLGPVGLFVVAFFDSSFLSLPEINDLLVVSSAAAHPGTAWMYVAGATLGSLAGCTVLWYVGRRGGEPLLARRFGQERVDRSRQAFRRWDVLALAVPALLPPPMPFKIFVLSAGVFGFPFRRFAATLLVARGVRYAVWAVLGVLYGDEALAFLRAFDEWFKARALVLLAAAGAVVVVGLAWWLVRRRAAGSP